MEKISDYMFVKPVKVMVMDNNHGMNPSETNYYDQPITAKEIKIGNGCWIGEKVCILSGVTIGDKSIIGANSTVTNDIPAYSIAVGSPAKVIKKWTGKKWERI